MMRPTTTLMLIFLSVFATVATTTRADDAIVPCVAKIECRKRSINYPAPWRKATTGQSRGTGVLIGKNRVLTNAHVVSHSTEITVQFGDGAKVLEAKLIAISQSVDLALLEFDNDPSLENIQPPKISSNRPAIITRTCISGAAQARGVEEGQRRLQRETADQDGADHVDLAVLRSEARPHQRQRDDDDDNPRVNISIGR